MVRDFVAASVLAGAALVLASGPGLAQAADPKPEESTFRVEQESIDVGDVVVGQEGVGVFVFHNDGDKDVRILRAKPS